LKDATLIRADRSVRAARKANCLSEAAGEVDVRVQAVGRVVTRNEVGAAGVDHVEPAQAVETDLEEIAEVEVTRGGRLD